MVHVPTNDGAWVSEKFLNLSEVIRDYDPQFELRWIPPGSRSNPEDHSRAYCIFDLVSQTPAFFAGEEVEPSELLARLFDIDNKNGDVLRRMEARNAAAEALRLKEKIEEAEQRQEYIAWLMASRRQYLTLRNKEGELHLYDDQFRKIR